MLNQLVPVTTVHDASDKEAIQVFDRLNKGGVSLRQADVQAATLARGPAARVLKLMREFVGGDRPRRLGFSFSFAFRTLVVFHRESARLSRLAPDWVDQPGPYRRTLAQSWHPAERAIEAALRFVDEDMGWCQRILVPSANALIVLAAALDRAGLKISEADRTMYRRWLCLTALHNVFQGSIETTMDRFLRGLKKSRRSPATALVGSLKRDERQRIRADDDLLVYGTLWGPASQVLYAWLKDRGAVDWKTYEPIERLARSGTDRVLGELTVHHIFARNLLKR